MTRTDELWLGPIDLVDGRRDPSDLDRVVVVDLPPIWPDALLNTLRLPFDERRVRVRVLDMARTVLWQTSRCLSEVLRDCALAPRLRGELAEWLPGERLASWLPLFAVREDAAGAVHIHSRLRIAPEDMLFIRTSPEPFRWRGSQLVGADRVPRPWLSAATELHAVESVFLGNHQCYYRKCMPGHELEYKFTFRGDVDIWDQTVRTYQALRAGELPGYIMEYRDEFQTWDYLNHLFEVVAPDEERGYISFIPTTDGLYTIKRKWYVEDALSRREEHYPAIAADGPLEEVVHARFGVQARRLPSYRRVRYDVNLESLRTGHVYGIFFDHCSLVAEPSVTLTQCEVEYLRSRTVLPPQEDAVMPELTEVAAWTRARLVAEGLGHREDFYSKLSFLRDAVAASPHLAGI